MHDAPLVGRLQRLGQRRHQLGGFAKSRRFGREIIRQRRAFDVLADQKRQAVDLADFMHRHDRRVLELGKRPRFALKAIQLLAAGQIAAARRLDRHDPVQIRIAGLVDGAKGSSAEHVDNLKLADALDPLDMCLRRAARLQMKTGATRWAEHFLGRCFRDQLNLIAAVRTNDMEVHGQSSDEFG